MNTASRASPSSVPARAATSSRCRRRFSPASSTREIVLVASDLPDAPILARAAAFGLPTATLPPSPFKTKLSPEGEIALVELLQQARGRMGRPRRLHARGEGAAARRAFPNRIINIHPSLLPAFKGLRAWEQALAAGVAETGCTVHFVNEDIDAGEIIAQQRVPVLPGDTPETLHARIQVAEHELYPGGAGRKFSPRRIESRASHRIGAIQR